jgi:hypothetical protein
MNYYNRTNTDENGYYEMNAPPGQFTLECWASYWENEIYYEDYFIEISLHEYQQLRLDIYLKREVPDDCNITFDFSLTWDQVTMTREITEHSDTHRTREMLDLDDDGEVTESEVSSYEMSMESMYDYYMEGTDTKEYFWVDDIDYLYIENSVDVQVEGAVGPTTSTAPIITTISVGLESNQTIQFSDYHEIQLNVTYDSDHVNYTFNIILPSLFEMTNYTATDNVNVTGTTEIKLEPYEDPNTEDDIHAEWVKIEVTRTI